MRCCIGRSWIVPTTSLEATRWTRSSQMFFCPQINKEDQTRLCRFEKHFSVVASNHRGETGMHRSIKKGAHRLRSQP